MELSLTEEQTMIRDAAEGFLAQASDPAAVRAAMESERGYDETIWKQIATELGWTALAVPEAYDGLGLGPLELALVMEKMGEHLLCSPFFPTVCLAANVLNETAEHAARQRFLPGIAAGELTASLPLPDNPDWTADGVTANRSGESWRLSGGCPQVPNGDSVDRLFVFAHVEGESRPALFTLPAEAAGLSVKALKTWDATRRFAEVTLKDAPAERCDDPERMAAGMERSRALARLYMAAEGVGVAQRCLDLTVEYTGQRKQFGRPVGSFQAVKHRAAEMMVRCEAARSAVQGVALLAGGDTDVPTLDLECATARATADDAAFYCAAEAIQLHGGVGFTWEYDPQLYFKRAQASRHWLGEAGAVYAAIAGGVLSDEKTIQEMASGLDVRSDAGDQTFREEVTTWMQAHLTGRFAELKHRGGPGDEDAYPELRKEWERELAAGGWTCPGWPEAYGGRGLPIERQVIFNEAYAAAGGPGRMGHIGIGLIGPTLIAFGTEDQQKRFLPGIRNGTEFWCQGYSEPSAGSDLANIRTRCWQTEDGSWRVSGQKVWTSLAQDSDWIFVLARSEPGSKGKKGLTFLLLDLDQEGVSIQPIRQLSGSSEFNEVFLDEAVAADADVVGEPGEGWKVAMGLLAVERGASTLGQQAHFAHELQLVIEAARARGCDAEPGIRSGIAEAWRGLRVLRYNALRMLSGGDGMTLGREALIYKYYWSHWHRDLGELAMRVLGSSGNVVSDDPTVRRLQQVFLFSRADTIYAGTSEIQLNLIAERGLGMPREPRG